MKTPSNQKQISNSHIINRFETNQAQKNANIENRKETNRRFVANDRSKERQWKYNQERQFDDEKEVV